MNNTVSNIQIDAWINDLVDKLGITESAPGHKFKEFLNSGDIKGCIESMSHFMNLPIKIDLVVVRRGSTNSSRFHSTDLVETDSNGRGTCSITAQVIIPASLPLYGSSSLKNYPICVKVSEDCQDYGNSFITIMAHELSHVVLYSLWHPEKENEIYTDLTAMVLGFKSIVRQGRQSISENNKTTKITTYGYLSDDQFVFALEKIEDILAERLQLKKKALRELDQLKHMLLESHLQLIRLKKYLTLLSKNTKRRINREDGAKIVHFHRVEYINDIEQQLQKYDNTIADCEQALRGVIHHTKRTAVTIRSKADALLPIATALPQIASTLNEDVKVLWRNLSILDRLKLRYQKDWFQPRAWLLGGKEGLKKIFNRLYYTPGSSRNVDNVS